MIAKLIKGTGFRGAIEYDLQTGKSLLLETNMAATTARPLAAEFGIVRTLRPTLKKAVCHVSLSLHPDEQLTDAQWCKVAHTWLEGMGFNNNQYVISRHTDAPHAHIHILVNRIKLDGKVVSDAHDYKRQEPIMRQLEKVYGLRQVPSSHEVGRKSLSKGEVEKALRTGNTPTRLQLQGIIDKAVQGGCTLNDFKERLASAGVEVRCNKASTGFISGVSFAVGDLAFKGSNLGKAYSWNALQQRGLQNEQDGHSTQYTGERGRPTEGRYEHGRTWGQQLLLPVKPSDSEQGDGARSGRSGSAASTFSPSEPAGGIPSQELGGSDSAFKRLAKFHKQRNRQREDGRAYGQGLSR